MAYRLKDYLYNDKLTKEQNLLMDRLYKLRMSGMAEAFEKQLLEPNTGLEPFEVRFAAIVNQEWDQRESKKVSAKYSCGFSNTLISSIIIGERYLDYFTTITEDRLWQLLAKPVFRWRNSSGLSMNAAKAV